MITGAVSKRFAPIVGGLLALSALCSRAEAAAPAGAEVARNERRNEQPGGAGSLGKIGAATGSRGTASLPNGRLPPLEGVSARLGPPMVVRFRDLPQITLVSRPAPPRSPQAVTAPSDRLPAGRLLVERVLTTIFGTPDYQAYVKPYTATEEEARELDTFDTAYDVVEFQVPRPLSVLRFYGGKSQEHGRWVSCCLQLAVPSFTQPGVGTWRADLRGLALPPTNTQDYLAIQVIPAGTTVVLGVAKTLPYAVPTDSPPVAGVPASTNVDVVGGGIQIYVVDAELRDSRRFKRHDGSRHGVTPAAGEGSAPIEVETNVLGPDLKEQSLRFWYDPISQISTAIWTQTRAA